MAKRRDTLVSVTYARGTAGVWRDADGSHWMSGLLERSGGSGVDGGRPTIEGIDGDTTVQGGLLPAGATRAEVVDDIGRRHLANAANGAWVIVLDLALAEPAPVHYLGEGGETVRPELPSDWRVEPVPDVSEGCPACGGTVWERVTPTDADSRGAHSTPEGNMVPTSVLVCVACGHEERAGALMRVTVDEDWEPHEDDLEPAAEPDGVRAVSNLDFPIFAVAGHEPRLSSWGSSNGDVDQVEIAHGDPGEEPCASVMTERERYEADTELVLARGALERSFSDEPWPENLSDDAVIMRLHARQREHRRLAASARVEPITLLVDGAPIGFQAVRLDRRWAGAARTGGVLLTVVAVGTEPADVALERVQDPSSLRTG